MIIFLFRSVSLFAFFFFIKVVFEFFFYSIIRLSFFAFPFYRLIRASASFDLSQENFSYRLFFKNVFWRDHLLHPLRLRLEVLRFKLIAHFNCRLHLQEEETTLS